MSMQDQIDRAGPVIDRVNAAIRENPLAAGLIGAGVAWMLFGGAKDLSATARDESGPAGNADRQGILQGPKAIAIRLQS